MNVTAVESTTLATVAYENAGRVLQLEFRSGSLYRYFDVPEEVYEGLLRASSKGRYFNEQIRDRFQHDRVAKAERA
jgi:hypothetical protein